MRLYVLGGLLVLMTLSGQVCAPQNPNTGDTGNNNTDNTDNDDTDTGSDNTGNNNGNTNTGGNNNNSGGNNVGPLPTQDEHVLGANSARVTVIEYVDFQCPFCGRFARNTFPTIKSEYVQTGKVKWILRHFPLRSIHPYAEIAAQATECANNQGSFWAYSDLVFEKQAELDALLLGRHRPAEGLCIRPLAQHDFVQFMPRRRE
jgi:protein-disulfide isomerase